MSQLCYTVPAIAELTGFSETAIKKAITQRYVLERVGVKDSRILPQLHAKKGSGSGYLVLAPDLNKWLRQLEDVQL